MPFLYSHRLINPLRLESAHRNASQDHQVLWARTIWLTWKSRLLTDDPSTRGQDLVFQLNLVIMHGAGMHTVPAQP